MTFAEDKDPVEALGADRPDEALGIGIRPGGSPRGANDLHTLRFEHFVERLTESMVSVVDEETQRCRPGLSLLGQVAGDLGTPLHVGRTVSDPAYQDSSAVEFDEEQHMEGFQSHRLDGEEVTSNDRCGLGPHELAPGVTFGTRPSLRGNDPADAGCRDLDAQLEQLTLDALVAPQGILLGQAPHQQLGLLGHRPLRIHPMGLGPFPPDELSMPTSQRVRGHQRRGPLPHWS
jgi:hypothetical protein